MQKILKKLVTVLILVNVCFFAYPIQTKAVSNLTASNFAELLTALSDSDTDIHITLTGFFDLTTTITIPAGKNVTIDGNHYNLKRGDGVTGDLITVESTATLTLEEVTIHGNKNNVPDADGSLILVDGILNLNSYAILINNYSGSKAGGGVHVNQSGTLNINDGVVCYNKSNSYGGGIYVAGAFNMNGGAVQNNDNSGSNSTVDGGGIYFSATASAATIANAQIYENSTTSSGGGFASYGAGLTITNTKIYDNHAITGAGFAIMQAGPSSLSGGSEVTGNIASDSSHTSGNGGGIYVGTNQSLTIDGALISGNTADVAGGGILNNGHLTIENAEITNNTSRMLGGGIASTIEMDFKAGTISGNHAVLGGGIYFTSNSSQIVNITGGTISENDAQYGGGIYIQNDSTVTISNVLLTKNTASDHGGGIFLTSTLSSNLVITDSTISFNKAETAGGGIGVPASDRNEVHIGSGVVFSDNCIKGQAYDINPADQATYESLVDQGTTWSKPMTQGYNNIDIEYEDGDPVEVVYFETNGGGSIDPQKVVPGGLATKPTDPVKANWYFSGWYSDNTLNNKYDFATPVAGTIVLYAKWVDNEDDIDYLVKFDSNGGSSVASQAVLRNTHVTKPVDPTKSSVFFSGWYSDQGLTTKYDFNLPVTSDMTLYAKWVSNEASIDYLVSFVTNGGSAVSSQTVIKGGTASKPVAPTYPSKYFSGWYSDQGLTTKYDFTTPVTADITLYAKWVDSEAEIDYLVRFESNGGSAVVSQAVLRNAHVTKPSDPTKSSVFFSGWYSDQGLTTKYDFNLPVTNDMTLYAKWVSQESSIDYLVSFVTNGGSAVSSQTVIKGGTASKPVAPTYPSKYFSGWYSDDTLNNKYDFDTPVTADITLYAKWVDSEAEIDYLVKFNSNGGSIVPSQTVVRDALVSKPTDPTKSSMFFSGWYSDQGLTTKYDFNTPVTSDMTLYAKWVSNESDVDYLVSFVTNGGSAVSPQTVNKGDTATKPVNPTYPSKYFSGWYSDKTLNNKYDFNTPVTADITLYAKWVDSQAEIDYLVRFESNGGSAVVSQSVLRNAYVTKPADPTYSSKYFSGWYSDQTLTTKYDFNTPVTSDMTLYAKWVNSEASIDYLVVFNSNGGSNVPSQTILRNALVTKPSNPTKSSMFFSGWYSDDTLNNKYDFDTPVTADITLYAKWVDSEAEIDYLVKFNSNGGSIVPSQTVVRDALVSKPTDPTKANEYFSGWYSDQTLTTKYDFNTPVTSDMTLYAKWVNSESSIDYLVSFVTNGGSAVSPQTVNKGDTATKPVTPTYPSKYFSGWYSDKTLNNKYDFATPVTADITLYAKWVDSQAEIDYLVRFESNGGTAVTSQTVLRNALVTKPVDPTYSSKYFSGWYSDQTLTTKYDFNTPVTSDMTLYAKWVNSEASIDYLVVFNSNGGSSVNSQTVIRNALVTKPTDPTKSSMFFSGWYSDQTLTTKYDFNTPVTSDMTLYAKWVNSESSIDYLVVFNSNGGSIVPSQTVVRDALVTKPSDPTKSSVFFSGWYSDQTLTTKYDFNTPVTSDMTLYAKWVNSESSIDYLVSFVTNGGSTVSPQTVIKGGTASEPVAPTYPSKYFSGWYSDDTLNNKYDFDTPVTADITLYAKWVDSQAEIDYLIKFNSNGGSNVNSQTVVRDALVTKPTDPTKSSMFFSGWYSDQTLTTKYDFNTPVTSDMTLYAKWVSDETDIDYLVVFNSNGGSNVPSQTVIRNALASKPSDPTKSSVFFSGWYSDDTLNDKYDFDTPVTADITLYAKWVDNQTDIDYLVKFNSNGGSSVNSQIVVRNALVTKPSDPTKANEYFSGWYSDQTLTTKYDFNTPVTSDMTLYAKWVSNEDDIDYLVSFNTNGGSAVNPQTVIKGGTASEPVAPTYPFKYFSGWYSDDTLNDKYDFDTPVTADITLYAKWVDSEAEIDYLIKFNSNGGSSVAFQIVIRNAFVTKPVDPTYSPKYFSGWYSDSSLNTKYDFNTPVTDDMTLYAKWVDSQEEVDYLVSFNSNGGTLVSSQVVKYGEKAIKPASPTKVGSKFTGWYSDAPLTMLYDFTGNVYSDLTLYARWGGDNSLLTYTIYFSKNIPFGTTDGVTAMPSPASVLANNPFVITAAYVPVGSPTSAAGAYTFKGWATSPTGSVAFKATAYNKDSGILSSAPDKVILGAIYGLNQSIPEVGEDMILYAIWLPPGASNGGSGSNVVLTGVTSSLHFYLLTMMMAAGILKIKKKKD